MPLTKIIAGGQTGADRAALAVARVWGVPIGGWIPASRAAEDGAVPAEFVELREAPTADPAERTRLNVIDSDGTLIVSHGALAGGSKLTLELAAELEKPVVHVDLNVLSLSSAIDGVLSWLHANNVNTLNVAGPRASEDPQIFTATFGLLAGVLGRINQAV